MCYHNKTMSQKQCGAVAEFFGVLSENFKWKITINAFGKVIDVVGIIIRGGTPIRTELFDLLCVLPQ